MGITLNNKKPNIILIMTDQQRAIYDFPQEWVEQNLPSLTRLQKTGMTYRRNYINTSPCWSNRGDIISGTYPLIHQVLEGGTTLSPTFSNFSKVLKKAGYRTIYKGKFHLKNEFDNFSMTWTTDSNAQEIAVHQDTMMKDIYGFSGWTAPDDGTAFVDSPTQSNIGTLGGGLGANDLRVITGEGSPAPDQQESVLDFIKNNADSDEPYCLVISLVNPHDISIYPGELEPYGYSMADFENYEGFKLPESFYSDDLSTKPDAQLNFLNGFEDGAMDEDTALNYLKFYAYLQTLPDNLVEMVMNTMTQEQLNDTLIIRTADHGEMAGAHGGLREKVNQFYQESINVPLIISNPVLFPEGQTCDELVSQIDILPTLAEIVGLDVQEVKDEFLLAGNSFAQTLNNPEVPANDSILFVFYAGSNYDVTPSGAANVICGLIDKKWKYGVYFAPDGGLPSNVIYPTVENSDGTEEATPISIVTSNWFPVVLLDSVQYELYDLENDPRELKNLLHGDDIPAEIQAVQKELHHQLTKKLTKNNSMPIGWRDIQI